MRSAAVRMAWPVPQGRVRPDGGSRRSEREPLVHVADVEPGGDGGGEVCVEVVLLVLLDHQHEACEPRERAVMEGVVEEGLAAGTDRRELLETAEARGAAGREDDQGQGCVQVAPPPVSVWLDNRTTTRTRYKSCRARQDRRRRQSPQWQTRPAGFLPGPGPRHLVLEEGERDRCGPAHGGVLPASPGGSPQPHHLQQLQRVRRRRDAGAQPVVKGEAVRSVAHRFREVHGHGPRDEIIGVGE